MAGVNLEEDRPEQFRTKACKEQTIVVPGKSLKENKMYLLMSLILLFLSSTHEV